MNATQKPQQNLIQLARIIGVAVVTLVAVTGAYCQTSQASSIANRRLAIPKIHSKLTAQDLGLVINTADPYSVEVGEYYVRRRGIPEGQVLRIELPVKPQLTEQEFAPLSERIREFMGPQVQALALAWTQPNSVGCNSITSAIAMGYAPNSCNKGCVVGRTSPYFNSASPTPFTSHGIRPTMLLAARSTTAAKLFIERGIDSDQQLGKVGVPMASALFVSTNDAARNVRAKLYPPGLEVPSKGFKTVVLAGNDDADTPRVFLYQTGLTHVAHLDRVHWLPGALADHLTSFGGDLLGNSGQMSALDWLESGATASYGTVSEPCNFVQKFPHPQILLFNYIQGATAIEAYWRSVAWPDQGVFIGEPLASPFGNEQRAR